MNDILFIFLSLSLSGSILALILFVIRPFTKNRLSQTWQYYIWLVVILRFLLPFTPQVSIMGEMTRQLQGVVKAPVVGTANTNYEANMDFTIPGIIYSQLLPEETPIQTYDEIPAHNEASKSSFYWRDILDNIWLLWIGVALVLFVHKLASYRSFVRFVNVGKNKITDTHILNIYDDELKAAKVRRQLNLYINEQVVSPMLVGILQPALVLPILETSDDELRQIFRHELTHFKRLDFLYKWIVQITLCLHWFNPLVYLINKQIDKSCELSCDESVIKYLDENGRIIYGDAIMASLTAQGKYSDFVVSITMSKNVDIVKERLDMIMSYKKKSKFVFCITAMLTVTMLCGFAFAGAYASPGNVLNPTDFSNTKEQYVKNINMLVENCNVTVKYSVNDQFLYDYDESKHIVTQKIENSTVNINVERILDAQSVSFIDMVVIYIPNQSYDNITVEGEKAGVSLPELYANLHLINHSGAMSVRVPEGFNKTIDLENTNGSGSLLINAKATDYSLKVNSQNSAVGVTSNFPAFTPNRTWEYKKGNGKAIINLDLEKSAFSIAVEEYNGTGKMAPMKTAKIKEEMWFLIETEAQLRSIGSEEYPLSAKYMLNTDITLSKAEDWVPIGTFDKPFTGVFNGNGYEIINLTIKNPDVKFIGMFAFAQNATICNVVLRNPDIQSAFQKGDSIAPILVIGLGGSEIYGNQIMEGEPDSQSPIMLNNSSYTYLTEANKGQLKSERIMFQIESSKAFLYLEMEDYSEPVGIKVFYGDTNKLVLSANDATFTEIEVPGFLVDRGKGLYSVELIRSKESASHVVTVYGVATESFTDYENITLPKNTEKNKVSTSNKTAVKLNNDSMLRQVAKEYTLAELKALNVSGISVDVHTENIVIERGGNKLILEYLQMSDGEYVISTQPDMGGTIEELSLRRTTPADSNEPVRSILVVIPDKADFIVTTVSTDSGIIRINGCVSRTLNCETKSGEITIIGGSVSDLLLSKTVTRHINISGIATGDKFRAFLESDSGEVFFQPQDKVENYQFIIDTKPQTRITVNGKDYAGGDFKLNGNAIKKVYFDSGQGSSAFTVQDTPVGTRVRSLEENFEKYKPFGVVYSPALDAVYYNGERVRLFVDFKQDKEVNMNYAFDLCFQDRLKIGELCLEAIEDKNGKVVGVNRLDNDIATELLRDLTDTPSTVDGMVLTFDATLKMESYGLEARDLTKDKTTEKIRTWMTECDKQQGAFINESRTDSGYITYIYCNQGGRYPWNISMHDGKVCVYLYSESGLAASDGYTLLYYTAPTRYDIRLYLDGTELNY